MLPTDPGAEERGVIGPHWQQSSPWLCSQACLQRSSTSCAAFALVEHTYCYLLNKVVSVAATQPALSYQRQLGAKEQADPNLLLHKSAAIAGDPDGGVFTTDGQVAGRCALSAGDQAWWKVDIGASVPVSTVRVSGGDGGSPNVMLQVTVSPDAAGGNSEHKCGLPMSLTAGATAVAVCDPAMIGRYLFLRATAVNQILSICEVAAYGPSLKLPDTQHILSEEAAEESANRDSIESKAQALSAEITNHESRDTRVKTLREEIVLGKSQLVQGLARDEYTYSQGSVQMHIAEQADANKASFKHAIEDSEITYKSAIAHEASQSSA